MCVDMLGKSVGSPWGKDQKDAAGGIVLQAQINNSQPLFDR